MHFPWTPREDKQQERIAHLLHASRALSLSSNFNSNGHMCIKRFQILSPMQNSHALAPALAVTKQRPHSSKNGSKKLSTRTSSKLCKYGQCVNFLYIGKGLFYEGVHILIIEDILKGNFVYERQGERTASTHQRSHESS